MVSRFTHVSVLLAISLFSVLNEYTAVKSFADSYLLSTSTFNINRSTHKTTRLKAVTVANNWHNIVLITLCS